LIALRYLYYTGFFCFGGTLFHQRFVAEWYTFSLAYTPIIFGPNSKADFKEIYMDAKRNGEIKARI